MISPPPISDPAPNLPQLLDLETTYGRPVGWAEVAMVTDIGDSHELNDDRCLVITSKDLGDRATGPLRDCMLCVLADGATGSTFGPRGATLDAEHPPAHAGWRASQLAQAVFVERFLNSQEVDLLDRLKDGLRAADRELVDCGEGNLSTTLTALFLSADGTAYAASIGDSVLLVLPPRLVTPGDRRLKKLGYEETTSVGSGDTTLSYVDENDLIEQWWPNKDGVRTTTRVAPGTDLVLLSDGISDNLPAEVIRDLLRRHPVDRATLALPLQTRERRAQTQRSGGGSTHQLGLDNMSAIVVRYRGPRRTTPADVPRLDDASLVTLSGTHGGPSARSGGQFGMICLAGQQHGASAMPSFVRNVIESELEGDLSERMSAAFLSSMPKGNQARLAVLAMDERGEEHVFSSGWVGVDLLPMRISRRTAAPARDSAFQRFLYTPKLWGSTLALAALLLLVSTAFATGAVRPSPPPAATLPPGEPTPTPDTRPVLTFGGFQLVPPAAAPTDRPMPSNTTTTAAAATPEPAPLNLSAEPPPEEPTETPPPPCRNIFGLLCGSPPAPPPRARPAPKPEVSGAQSTQPTSPPAPAQEAPLPVASPAPATSPGEAAPRPGSNLDAALKIASMANDQFNRSLEEPTTGN